MKKFIIGFTCGVIISMSTAVFASDTIQAYLFPSRVKFHFNNVTKEIDGSEVINYNSKAYIPLRSFSEAMGATVNFKPASGDNGNLNTIDIYPSAESHSVNLTDNEVKDVLNQLIPKAVNIYAMFNGSGWFKIDTTKTISNEIEYCLVTGETWKTNIDTSNVKSVADIKRVVEDVFTKDIAEKVFYSRYLTLTPDKGDRPLYKDYEGKLYEDTKNGGHGWATKFLIDTAKLKDQKDNVAEIELDTKVLDDPGDKIITIKIEYVNDKWLLASRLD